MSFAPTSHTMKCDGYPSPDNAIEVWHARPESVGRIDRALGAQLINGPAARIVAEVEI